jgi:phosphosulfolactate synthase
MLTLPARHSKPRNNGITSIHDTFLTVDSLKSILTDYGDYIDVAKFGVGSAFCTRRLQEKINVYKEFDIKPYFGGTLFEKYYSQGKIDEYLGYLQKNEISMIEVSTGTVDISLEERCSIIREVKNDFVVFAEVGSKDSSSVMPPSSWIAEINKFVDIGATYVITEGRDSGTPGLFRDSGELREGLFEDIKSSCPVERIIFEAPHSKSQMFFINNIGSNVNLGNVNPMDVLLLETQRLGLRSETFGVVS